MSLPRPPVGDLGAEELPAIDVDWSRLPEGWERSAWKLRHRGESDRGHANRIRALVVEGIAPASALEFADLIDPC